MARSGWSAAIRSSNRIYEKSPSDPRCSPRIANHLRRCSTTESRLALAVERVFQQRSEEHTSELQSPYDLVCRLLLEKKNAGTVTGSSGNLISLRTSGS